jgi:hypothetical protein
LLAEARIGAKLNKAVEKKQVVVNCR